MATLSFEDNINKQLEGFDTNDFFTVNRIQPLLIEAFTQPEGANPFKSIQSLMESMQFDLTNQLGLPSGDIDIGLRDLLSNIFDATNMSLETKNLLLFINDMICNGLSLPKFHLGKIEILLLGLMFKFYLCKGDKITSLSLQNILIKTSNIPLIGEMIDNLTVKEGSLPLTHHTHGLLAEWEFLNQEFVNGLNNEQTNNLNTLNQYDTDEELLTSNLIFMLSTNEYTPSNVNYNNSTTEGQVSNYDPSNNNTERVGEGEYNNKFIKGYIPIYTIGLPFSMAYQGTNIKGINDLVGKRKEIQESKKALRNVFEQSLTGDSLAKYNEMKSKRIEIDKTDNQRVLIKNKKEELLTSIANNLVSVNRTVVSVMNMAMVSLVSDGKKESMSLMLKVLEDFYSSDASNGFKDLKPNLQLSLNTFFNKPLVVNELSSHVQEVDKVNYINVVSVLPLKKDLGEIDKTVLTKLLKYRDFLDLPSSEELYISSYGSSYYEKITDFIIPSDRVFTTKDLTTTEISRML